MRLAYDIYQPFGNEEETLPPVILLHCLFDCRNTWKYIGPEIARRTGRKVYTVDARNHGESPWSNKFTLDIVTEDLDAFLDQHNIPKAALVGHCVGGRAALTLAVKKPEKVEKIVIEDMHTETIRLPQKETTLDILKIIQDTMENLPSNVDDNQIKKAFMKLIAPLLGNDDAKIRRIQFDADMLPLKKQNGSISWQTNFNGLKSFFSTGYIGQHIQGVYLGEALFMYGTKSIFKVDKNPPILECLPKAIKLGIEGGSHLIHFENPERYVDEVASFINGYSSVKSKY